MKTYLWREFELYISKIEVWPVLASAVQFWPNLTLSRPIRLNLFPYAFLMHKNLPLRQIWAPYLKNWGLASSCQYWPVLAKYSPLEASLVQSSPVAFLDEWKFISDANLSSSARKLKFDHFWSFLAISGQIWPFKGQLGQIRPCQSLW